MDVFALSVKLQAGGQADVEKALKSVGLSLKATQKAATVAAAAIGAAFVGITALVYKNTNAQAEALAQLDGALKSTGEAAGFTFRELQQQAAELQNLTIFGDDQIMRMQAGLVRFGNLSGETFRRTQMAILSVASTGKDLESTMMQIGRAVNDPIRGMALLTRTGIALSESQQALVRRMVETNNIVGAQTALLEAIEGKYKDQIEATSKTLPFALKQLGNAFGDLWEVPEIFEAIATRVKALVALLGSAEVKQTVRDFIFLFSDLLVGAVSLSAGAMAHLANIFTRFKFDLETGKFEKTGFFAGAETYLSALAEQAKGLRADIAALKDTPDVQVPDAPASPIRPVQQSVPARIRDLGVTFTAPEMGDMWEQFRQMMEDRTHAAGAKDRKKLELMVPVQPKVDVGAFADAIQASERDLIEAFAGLNFGESVGESLVDGVANGIEQAVASGRLGDGFRAFGATMLAGLGDAMISFGKSSAAFAGLLAKIKLAFSSLNPAMGLAASVALIGLGSALKGAARGMFGGMGGVGMGGGGLALAGAGGRGNDMFTRVVFGPTNANVAAGMEPRTPMNVTVIGPNDPQAQRQIQELISRGGRR